MSEENGSRVAGYLVAGAGIGTAFAVLFAFQPEVAVLVVWLICGAWLWYVVRKPMSDMPATPPPRGDRPSCRECAGHELVGGTPSETREGMLIFKSAPPDRPNHTHIHIVEKGSGHG